MRRVFGTVLLGLGIALVVFAAGLRFYVTPLATNIPYDLKPSTTVAESPNSSWLSASALGIQVKTGKLTSYTDVVPQPKVTNEKLPDSLKGKAVVWDVYSQIKDPSGNKVSASISELALDRLSGAAVAWDGTYVDDGNGSQKITYTGNSYKLPFNTGKHAYPFWDDTAGTASDLYYTGTETVNGVEAYVFQQSYTRVKANVADSQLSLLSAAIGDGSDKGGAFYSTTRTIWVEPTTGQFLNVRETPHLWYETTDEDGKLYTITMLLGTFEYTDQTKADALDTITSNRDQLQLVSFTLPIAGGGGGLVLLIIGIILLAAGRKPEATTAAPAAATPAAV